MKKFGAKTLVPAFLIACGIAASSLAADKVSITGELRVSGKVTCTEIQVTPTVVPDYVFGPDYKLQPLSEVEKYINQNRHLPGIPSENEIQNSGMNVADMQMKMLEKIEELTLHMIALEKENARLSAELAQSNLK